ncbi:hypothetical protein KBC51_02170 [Candidatus Saccharibacteria bacterium]|nr:hypothetical protein [Candidatus Saccharibacteria bacterium]
MENTKDSKNIFTSLPARVALVAVVGGVAIGSCEGFADKKAERITYGSLTCEGNQPLPAEADQTLDDFINSHKAEILGLGTTSDNDLRGIALLKLGEEPFYQNPNETNLRFKATGYYNLPLRCD